MELHEHRLTVGPSGRLQADVRAREIIVVGSIQGNVEATERIDIKKHASIIGDLKGARFAVEDGAHVKGTIETNGVAPSVAVPKVGGVIPIGSR